MSFEYFQELAKDLENLFTTEKGYDVIIYAGKNDKMQELHAHLNILCARSQYFCTEFSNNQIEKKDGKVILRKPDISSKFFKIILRFIYCGKIDLGKLQGPEVLKLLILVGELKIQSLISCIQKYLIKHQDEFLQQNPIGILETIYQHESFTDLWNYCLEKICEEPELLFNSNEFINLKAPFLKLLLKRDDLDLDEIDTWNSLLKWSFAQNPSISKDFTKWSNEEIKIMERTLLGFIPLIRFYHISSDDFLDKVFPLKKLLPEDLFNDLLIFHIAPNRKPNVYDVQPPRQPKFIYDSTLIKTQHFVIFASWIEKKNNSHYNVKNIPYNFNLLYRASRDGNTVEKFHEKCDNKGATIVIVKLSNSEQIVGGYNPLQWDSTNSSGTWKSTKDSFIFLFTNRTNLQTSKVSYSNGDQYSIFCYPSYGPCFGPNGNLLYCTNNSTTSWTSCWNNSQITYPKLDIPANFNMDDYEVFQVVKK